MRLRNEAGSWKTNLALMCGLMLVGSAAVVAQTTHVDIAQADNRAVDAKGDEAKPVHARPDPNLFTYQTLYISNLTQQNDANDLQTAMRNMLPNAKLYYVPSQGAISVRGTPEDLAMAQKMVADLDRPKKTYRLTYTITESAGGKQTGVQHISLIVISGGKTNMKKGRRVPLVTGTTEPSNATTSSQVQYIDVGLNIDASLDGSSDGLRLRTKVEQSQVAEEKSGVGTQDPVIQQSMLEGMSILGQGKPLMLGTMDLPADAQGGGRKQEISVISELVQ